MNDKDRKLAINGIDFYKITVDAGINFCHPSTYLNQKRWNDEITPSNNTKNKASKNEQFKEKFFHQFEDPERLQQSQD